MNQRSLAPKGTHYDVNKQTRNQDASNVFASNGTRPAKRRRVACNNCRQAKTRCEGSDITNKPCDRCAELSRDCIVDIEFKRVNKKIKLDELQRQVEQLRSQVRTGQNAQSQAGSDGISSPLSSGSHVTIQQNSPAVRFPRQSTSSASVGDQSPVDTGNSNGVSVQANLSPLTHEVVIDSDNIVSPSASRSLEDTTLSTDQIADLFHTFFRYYHPKFPILNAIMSPDDAYTVSPLLFWTVILIGARKYDGDISLMSALSSPVRSLLWSTISSPPQTISSIKAFCLLLMWPFPTSSMSTDISYTLAGIAVSSATHIGLHRPELLQDFSRTKCQLGARELSEAATTWSACYIAAESVTTSIGQASYFETEHMIDKACKASNPYNLSTTLYRLLLIQRFCNKVHLIMRDRHDDGHRSTLMKILEREFEVLVEQVGDERFTPPVKALRSSSYISLLLLSAKLQLQTYHLFDDSDTLVRRQGVINAYATALKIILDVQNGDKEGFQAKYLPGNFILMCYLAAIVVMKVANSSYSHCIQVETGKQAFNYIISMSRNCCVEDNDLMGRMSKILAQLWNVHRSLAIESQHPPSLKIKSRSLYSIVHDSLWLWRERFGGQPGNGAPSLRSTIVPEKQPRSVKDTVPTMSPYSLSIPEVIPNITVNAESSRQIAEPSLFPPNPTDNTFMTSTFGGTQEEEDWMWNIGLPSFNGMDLDVYASHYSMNYEPHDQL